MKQEELTFTLTEQEAAIVLQALSQSPYYLAAPIIQKIQEQATIQLAEDEKAN